MLVENTNNIISEQLFLLYCYLQYQYIWFPEFFARTSGVSSTVCQKKGAWDFLNGIFKALWSQQH